MPDLKKIINGDDYTNDLQQAYMERNMLIIEVR